MHVVFFQNWQKHNDMFPLKLRFNAIILITRGSTAFNFICINRAWNRERCLDDQTSSKIDCVSTATFCLQSLHRFKLVRFSTCQVTVNPITHWSTCKRNDITKFTVVVVCRSLFWMLCFGSLNVDFSGTSIHVFHAVSHEKIKMFVLYPR